LGGVLFLYRLAPVGVSEELIKENGKKISYRESFKDAKIQITGREALFSLWA